MQLNTTRCKLNHKTKQEIFRNSVCVLSELQHHGYDELVCRGCLNMHEYKPINLLKTLVPMVLYNRNDKQKSKYKDSGQIKSIKQNGKV